MRLHQLEDVYGAYMVNGIFTAIYPIVHEGYDSFRVAELVTGMVCILHKMDLVPYE